LRPFAASQNKKPRRSDAVFFIDCCVG